MRITPLLTIVLLAAPSAAWSRTSAAAEPRQAVCLRTIPGDANRAARTVRVACTHRSIPPVLDPTPLFLP